jgi:hypothetical protein
MGITNRIEQLIARQQQELYNNYEDIRVHTEAKFKLHIAMEIY